MESGSWSDFGAVGAMAAFAILVIQMVLKFLSGRKSRNGNGDPKPLTDLDREIQTLHRATDEILRLSRDLHTWHNVKDDDGVFMWINRRSLEQKVGDLSNSIAKLADAITTFSQVQTRTFEEQQRQGRLLGEMDERLRDVQAAVRR